MSENRKYISAKAIGTTCELWYGGANSNDNVEEIFLSELKLFEDQFSRFIETSETSKFNKLPINKWQNFSPDFFKIYNRAMFWLEHTKGIFNPFVLPILKKIGYTHSWGHDSQSKIEKIDSNIQIPKFTEVNDFVIIDKENFKLKKKKNVEIDFGGIGKGYLADILFYKIMALSDDFCISLGGDMIVWGKETWEIKIEGKDGFEAGKINIKDLAIATSSVEKRKFEGGNHIIDPRTGESVVSKFGQVSVVSHSAESSDVLSKVLIVDPDFSSDKIIEAYGIEPNSTELLKIK